MQSPNLRIDFYESGKGETVVITFPSGKIGIIDAHPSSTASSRPDITDIIGERDVEFLCLTHPHEDHGADLIKIIQKEVVVHSFWSNLFIIIAICKEFNNFQEIEAFPSGVVNHIKDLNESYARSIIELASEVVDRDIFRKQLHDNIQPINIDGVLIQCLSPSEQVVNEFENVFHKRSKNCVLKFPDQNKLSIVLHIKFGDSSILLGSDALKAKWEELIKKNQKEKNINAKLLKVPHHGASNAFILSKTKKNYLSLCSKKPRPKCVLFAGSAKHPNSRVYEELLKKTDVYCTINGLKNQSKVRNSLKIGLTPVGSVSNQSSICNSKITFELTKTGDVNVVSGVSCNQCQHSSESNSQNS
jgi:beta-lactamase superfamily II metal-dependent hydrolase